MPDNKKKDKILVTRSSLPSLEEYVEEIKSLWETHWLTNMGAKHQMLEENLREYLSVEQISLFSNGHMALELAIQAMDLTGEVITTPFTFASTTHAIVRNRLKPVFCDIDPATYTIDVNQMEDLITDRTTAIVPVHVYGNICRVEEIEKIAEKHHLKVIYDAAHTFGEFYKGRGIGTFGDASVFSFHATKVFHTAEGGAVSFSDANFGKKLYQLKNFGICNEECVDSVGANAKMNEFQAAMGLCNLRHIDEEIKKRKAVVECYQKCLADVEGIRFHQIQPDVKPNYAYFPLVFDEQIYGHSRDEVHAMLAEHNIIARKYFYPLTSAFDCYSDQFDPEDTPVAFDLSKRVMTLPLYADLSLDTAEFIAGLIRKFAR